MTHANQIHSIPLSGAGGGATHTKHLPAPNLSISGSHHDMFPASTFECNKLLRTHSSSPLTFHLCLSLFSSMLRSRLRRPPNLHSFTFAFSACAASSRPHTARALHALLSKLGFQLHPFISTSLLHTYSKTNQFPSALNLFDEIPHRDVAVYNSMISGYTRIGDLGGAQKLFDDMTERNVISWTSMISGYSQNGRYGEAIEMFSRMWEEAGGVMPNAVTLTSVLPACANLGAMELGERIEVFARGNGLFGNVFVGSSLVEMYAKCGDVGRAEVVFREVAGRRNVCAWNSMIMGFAVHGRWNESLLLFQQMKENQVRPDEITFTGVLMACSHGGLVEEGKRLFKYMEKDLLISPKIQHYGCMVDLLGRAGFLNEAYSLIKTMPMLPDSVIWGALLGACSFHGDVELAETAAKFLFKLEPWNTGNYVILANVYASAGRWGDVARVRRQMKGRREKKSAGYSLVESDGIMHKFLVEDKSHPRTKEIYELLNGIYIIIGFIDLDSDAGLT